MYKKYTIHIVSTLLILVVIIAILIHKVNIFSLHNYHKKIFHNYQFQAIECFNNLINLVDESGDLYEYVDNNLNYQATLIRKEADTQKKQNALAHSTSVILLNNKLAIASSSFARLPGQIIFFNYNNVLKEGYLSEKNIKKIISNNNIRATHLQYINLGNKELIFKFDKSFNEKTHAYFYDIKLDNLICSIDIPISNFQNTFWDDENRHLYILRNPIKNRGGQIITAELVEDSSKCPTINIIQKNTLLNSAELEDYAYCNDKQIFLFIEGDNSFILIEK